MEEEKSNQDHLLPEEIKYAIILYKREGTKSDNKIAEQISNDFHRKIGHSTVQAIFAKYQKTGTVSNEWSDQGRPKSLTLEEQERLIETARNNRLSSTKDLKDQLNFGASRETLNRELLRRGYKAYRAPVKPLLTDDHKRQRLLFAEEHRSWHELNWATVVFSDESFFRLVHPNGRIFVRRLPEEELEPEMYQQSVTKSKGIMVWGSISSTGVGPLIRIDGKLNAKAYLDLFRHRLWYYFPGLYDGTQIFQADGAGPHGADIVHNWFTKYDIKTLEWPARSPDLNIIEDCWNKIEFDMRGRVFDSQDDLWNEVNNRWRQLSLEFLTHLYTSLPNRMLEVIKAQGGVTRY